MVAGNYASFVDSGDFKPNPAQSTLDPAFPTDLSGHFTAQIELLAFPHRWSFAILDYQSNVLLRGVTRTSEHATAIVTAWDVIVCALPEADDPSLGWADAEGDVDGWSTAK